MTLVPRRPAPAPDERGIVLAAALLFVLLTSVLVLTFMTTTTGERSQSSNVQTAKLALYAADAGVRTQQQILANIAQLKIDSCVARWNSAGGIGAIVTTPDSLFPRGVLGGAGAASATNPPFNASASISFADSDCTPASQVYNYLFSINATGNVRSTGKRSVQSTGLLRVSATRGTFADYLLFTNTFTMADGSTIWFTSAGSFDGRVHTNTGFKFAYKPTFQDQVTQHSPVATFYNGGNTPVTANANNNGTIDVPNFFGGYLRGQTTVPLPTNSYNQQDAALGVTLAAGVAPTNSQINTACATGAGSGTPPDGIYLPHSGTTLTGGIYVQGTADKVKMWADTLANKQYYQITQGGTNKTLEVDHTLNTTKVWNGLSTSGSPADVYTNTLNNSVLYSTGAISDLTGPDRNATTGYVNPAVAENSQLLITAASDIVIQGDITCDNFNGKNNVLGIYSSGGSVRIGATAPNNVNIDAFVMAIGATGQFSVDNYNSGTPRGSANLRGGVVSQYYGAFYTFDSKGNVATGYGRNFHYDRRGLTPPFYPTTTRFDSDLPSARTVAWKEI